MKPAKYRKKNYVNNSRDTENTSIERVSREEDTREHGHLTDDRYTSVHVSLDAHVERSERYATLRSMGDHNDYIHAHECTSMDADTLNVPEHTMLSPKRIPASAYEAAGRSLIAAAVRARSLMDELDYNPNVSDRGLEIAPVGGLGVAAVSGLILMGGTSMKRHPEDKPATEADVWSDSAFTPTGEGYKLFIESVKDARNDMGIGVYIMPDKIVGATSLTEKPIFDWKDKPSRANTEAFREELTELRKSWLPSKQPQPVVLPVSRLEKLPRELWLEFSMKYLGF